MKRNILIWTVTALVTGLYGYAKLNTNVLAHQDTKITICHATSSAVNPYVTIHVDEHAENGHLDEHGTPLAGHEEDLVFAGVVACPGEQYISPTPTRVLCSPTPSVEVTLTPTCSPLPTLTLTPSPTLTVSPTPTVQPTATNAPSVEVSVTNSWTEEKATVFPGEGKTYGPQK